MRRAKGKQNPETWGQCNKPQGQLQKFQYSHYTGAERGEQAKNWKAIEKTTKLS